ncbi:Desmoplakin [Labeo rohita]|uniref:Desmoplakin n=1 Tax=Labeo rohita TaxID=84645 RepID=A0ABQ8LQS9_LABRO|nr:Desmoplakin [Labeo rohita]
MSMYGSQRGLSMMGRRTGSRSELNAAAAFPYARSDVVVQRGNNGFTQEYVEGYSQSFSRGSMSAGQVPTMTPLQQQISFLQAQCQDYLDKAAIIFKSMRDLNMALNGPQLQQKYSTRSMRRSMSREEPNRYFTEAMGWILQQRRLIETSSWGDDLTAIEQQIANHSSFHSSIQRSGEVDRARAELLRGKDQNAEVNKSCLNKLEQEWDSLLKASYQRSVQLQELRCIIEEISNQIMWVNDREEEELVFDWGDKNIDTYIPQKQESFSKLMSELEQKEIQLNVLKSKVDNLLKNKHPASDKIQAYMETLQTQWSWLLQITKCINVHLKENARYSQFFKEASDMNSKLQKEHDNIRKNFSCDKSTPLHNLLELLQGLERERERLTEQREMVQQLVLKSKSIVRLKPRNPDEKITGQNILVQALCDFRQDEKTIRKGDEGILKDNSERTTWHVTGPGGMDMQVPSVCLLVPPPNPLAVSLANKNSQYYEAILGVWNQLYINVKTARGEGSEYSAAVSVRLLNELNALRFKLDGAESSLVTFLYIPIGEDGPEECGRHIASTQVFQKDVQTLKAEFQSLRDSVQNELKDATNTDKAKYLREQLDIINQRLVNLENYTTVHVQRLNSVNSLLKDVLKAEDVVKVYEARLTEKETASLDPEEVLKYQKVLQSMRSDLEQKQDLLNSLLADLNKLQQYNEQTDQGRYRCIINLSQYGEYVNQLSDRWKRIQIQINNRLDDLDAYQPHLQRYLQSSSRLNSWIGETQRQLDSQHAVKTDNIAVYVQLLNQHKALNSDIKAKRELLETVQKDGETCINAIKIRNTRIELLEEELQQMRDAIKDHAANNASLQEALLKYQQELNESQTHRLSLEEVKRTETLKCMATQESLDSSTNRLQELMDEVRRLKLQLDDMERKKKVVEERYTFLQEEHDETMRKKLKELEQTSWAKMELEKTVSERTRELERLRRELEDEARRIKEAQAELAKVRQEHNIEIREMKQTYESQIHVTQTSMQKLSQQKESDAASMSLEFERLQGESRELKEQLQRLRVSLAQEEAQRKHLQEEVQRLSAVSTEEGRKRHELESQVQLLLSQKHEADNKMREVQESSTRTLQEKSSEINRLTRCLEEEQRLKRSLEAETRRLKEELADLKTKNENFNAELVQLHSSHQELSLIRVELEAHALEKGRSEQTIARLQTRIHELQEELKHLESELEKQRQVAEEEASKRRRTESQLEKSSQAMREYTTTITTLRKSQEETNLEAKHADEECKQLKEALDRALKEHKVTSQSLAVLKAEMNTLKLQLTQEQGRVQDSNQRYEALHRSMEEKTCALNIGTAETERLQRLNETLTKDRLRLEEELRSVRLAHDELLQNKKRGDRELTEQIAALQKQLESSQRASAEHDRLMRQLSREREKLQVEIENVQKQARETSTVIQTSQYQCSSLEQERDGLIKKMGTMEQDIMRLKKLEDELARIKLSLESELRLKSQMQEENERIKKDFTQWKTKCATHEEQIRQHNSERSGMERQFNSVQAEMERLRMQLKETEERYRLLLQNLERERAEMQSLRESQQNELLRLQRKPDGATKYTQTDLTDSSSLVFEGVRKKVTAQQLHDCGVLDKVTFEQLMNGQRTVEDVSVDIRLNLKGTGAIAGLAGGPKGKMTFTEAKNQNLISDESGNMLLEAQAATGYIIDPRANVRMTVEEACLNGLVNEADKKQLLIAEAACIGFRDPKTGKLLPVSQAMKKGIVNRETALRLLQAQEAAGGIIDPTLSVYLSKDTAMDRDLVDGDLYQALNAKPDCYIDPDTGLHASYVTLKKRCKADLSNSLLLLPAPEKPMTVKGLRHEVSVSDLVDAKLLQTSDVDNLREGKITSQDIEHRLRAYLRGSTCIAGIYDETKDCTLPIYQAMKDGLLRPGTTLELLEAQAASGFMIDPILNEYYTVEEACKKGLVGVEFKDKLLAAERAVTGYKDPGTNKMISLFEAIERGLIEKGHGIRLLEAQIASGGIIDPKHSHRIDVDVAYQKGYFGEEMNQILKDEGDDTKGFFDPNTEDNLTYLQLKSRCIADKKTGLVLLPLYDKRKMQQKNSTRKRRVLIVDPESNKEMTVREAYEKKLIDYETFLELSQQECEWEETIITAPDGSTSTAIMDKQTGIQYDLKDLLVKGVIDQNVLDKYRSGNLTLTELADMITNKTKILGKPLSSSVASSSFTSQMTTKSQIIKTETIKTERISSEYDPLSTNSTKHVSSMSIKLTPLVETIEEQNPVGAIFDTEKLEKISICDALKRGIIDSITAQRLMEAQACTGGVVNPENGRRISIQEATRLGILDDDMANRIKPAQKAYIGFEEVKTKRKMSAAEAVKEKWLPYEAGQRFLEFQYLTGGLFDPEHGCRRSLEDALQLGWLDMRAAQRLQDTRHHPKTLTCPKTKLRISYKEALEGCMTEENTAIRMLPAATVSSRGISSPYNLSNPGSASGSRSGSRRGSVDYALSPSSSSRYSSFSYSKTSFSSRSLS